MKQFGIVYVITNIENGHQYVGQTTGKLRNRWTEHKRVGKKCKVKTYLYN